MNKIASFIKNSPIIPFCIIAFLITWGLKSLYLFVVSTGTRPFFNFSLIAQFGPSISALLLFYIVEGRSGLRKVKNSILNWRVGQHWLIIAFLFEPVIFWGIMIVSWMTGTLIFSESDQSALLNGIEFVRMFLFGLFFWGLSEEIGWRGWLFPHLQTRYSPLVASLILVLIISFWHMDPTRLDVLFTMQKGLFLHGQYPVILERLLISIPFTLVKTYLFNNTRGSLLVMMIFHSASNTGYFWTEGTFHNVQTDFFREAFLVVVLCLILVMPILLIRGKKRVLSI